MDGLIICLLVVIIALQVFFRPRKDHSDIAGELKRLLDEMQRSFERIEKNFREDFRLNREEGRIAKSSLTWTNNNACWLPIRKSGWKKSA